MAIGREVVKLEQIALLYGERDWKSSLCLEF